RRRCPIYGAAFRAAKSSGLHTPQVRGLSSGIRLPRAGRLYGPLTTMLLRPVFTFIAPALPSPAERPPVGGDWVHEIKHDGYRLMARRDAPGVRRLTRNGKDWSERSPAIVEAASALKTRSCLLDGEAVACDDNGLAVFERLRRKRDARAVFLYAFD